MHRRKQSADALWRPGQFPRQISEAPKAHEGRKHGAKRHGEGIPAEDLDPESPGEQYYQSEICELPHQLAAAQHDRIDEYPTLDAHG